MSQGTMLPSLERPGRGESGCLSSILMVNTNGIPRVYQMVFYGDTNGIPIVFNGIPIVF